MEGKTRKIKSTQIENWDVPITVRWFCCVNIIMYIQNKVDFCRGVTYTMDGGNTSTRGVIVKSPLSSASSIQFHIGWWWVPLDMCCLKIYWTLYFLICINFSMFCVVQRKNISFRQHTYIQLDFTSIATRLHFSFLYSGCFVICMVLVWLVC